jgi:hypothetical protein
MVDNLVAEGDGSNELRVTWNERPGPDAEKISRLIGTKNESREKHYGVRS